MPQFTGYHVVQLWLLAGKQPTFPMVPFPIVYIALKHATYLPFSFFSPVAECTICQCLPVLT